MQKVFLAWCLLLALSFESSAHAADGQALRFHEIAGSDGTPLNVVETGNAAGPAVVLLHGFSQSYLSFALQLHDPELNKRFRLIAIDLRGHGGSGKPWAREA
ncbi:MAG: alpha/beta fold hydrolase, partial [Gammaproteobacteria bacterium]|nr:alpha/beta fold hydrolase [Gammaproteobacteria bacterium]